MPQAARGGALADAEVGEQHRQQHQVGEDQHRHTDAGGDRQVLDHRNVDQHQHGEAHGVGQQRGEAGQEQAAEGVTRRHQLVGAAPDVLHDAVHLLRAMADADGVDQERHQDRVRVQLVAEQRQQAEQPDHPDQGAALHDQRAAPAAGELVEHRRGDQHRHGEERQHRVEPFDQIAHDLGEADDVDVHALGLVLAAQLFERVGEGLVVERLTGLRVEVEQRQVDDGRAQVARHQLADLAGAFDVGAQAVEALGAAVEAVRYYRAAIESLLGDALPAGRRGPQRPHERAVDAGHQVKVVVDLLQGLHVLGGEDVTALPGRQRHGDAQRVAGALEVLGVFEVRQGEGMVRRDGLEEAGVEAQAAGGDAEQQSQQQADADHQQTVVEQQPFETVAGMLVEIRQRRDGGEAVVGADSHGS
ncbi:hypothetical protein D9M70_311060 [compost metagenome]